MSILITDRELASKLRAEREKTDGAQYDEVWDGVYVMSPIAGMSHQWLIIQMVRAFQNVLDLDGGDRLYAGLNVSDREVGWLQNYRIPDLAVVRKDNPAKDCETHLCGGPDFVVEILSADDLARKKRPFYAKLGVRELLIIDRDPWGLELYRLEKGELALAGRSTLDEPVMLASAVLPLVFRLVPGPTRPQIAVQRVDGTQTWTI
jgi:Uma2 family endonuclease